MCFGGGGKAQSVPAVPDPSPVPTPEDTTQPATAQAKRAKISALQRGALATIKTSPLGIAGTGADLSKQAAAGNPTKTTIGA